MIRSFIKDKTKIYTLQTGIPHATGQTGRRGCVSATDFFISVCQHVKMLCMYNVYAHHLIRYPSQRWTVQPGRCWSNWSERLREQDGLII